MNTENYKLSDGRKISIKDILAEIREEIRHVELKFQEIKKIKTKNKTFAIAKKGDQYAFCYYDENNYRYSMPRGRLTCVSQDIDYVVCDAKKYNSKKYIMQVIRKFAKNTD